MSSKQNCTTASKNPRYLLGILALLIISLLPVSTVNAFTGAPVLTSDTTTSSAGFYRLSWQTTAIQSELQEATNSAFRDPVTIYIGPDRASVLSGKHDGQWYYRARAVTGEQVSSWSDTVMVTVAHHELSRAVLFFILGLVVFISIVALIGIASRKSA